jgi:ATP-dependent Clp protease ATP-binding subunit ClpC
MREELLHHLTAVYEEELKRAGDEEVAVEQARRRFGDPGDLTQDLRESVSRWDYLRYVLELGELYRPGESPLRSALRQLAFNVAAMTCALPLVLPIMWLRGRVDEIGIALRVLLVLCFFSAAFGFSLTLFGVTIGQVLYGRRPKRFTRTMVLYGLASLTVFPVLICFAYWGFSGGLASALSGLILGCAVAPTAPLLFFVLARQMRVEIQQESQWTDVEIEDCCPDAG